MSSPHARLVRQLLLSYQQTGRLVLLFDYDGTITPLVEQPRLARLDRPTHRLLRRLSRHSGVHLGVISSRPLEDLKNRVGIPNICLAGSSGLEMEVEAVRSVHRGAREAAVLVVDILQRLAPEVAAFPGAWIEDKRLSLTIHYRKVASDQVQDLLDRVLHNLQPCLQQIRIEPGPLALEVTPNLDWNKATAVSHFVRHYRVEGGGVLYAGDAGNDALALKTVAMMGGIAIGVGPDAPPTATCRLADAPEFVRLLTEFQESLASERRHTRSPEEHRALYGMFSRFFPMSSF